MNNIREDYAKRQKALDDYVAQTKALKFMLWIVCVALMFVAAVYSTESKADDNKPTLIHCESVEKSARMIMKGRQNGYPLVEMIKIFETKLGKDMVIAAYKKPRYSGDKYKKISMDDFANDYFLSCLDFI